MLDRVEYVIRVHRGAMAVQGCRRIYVLLGSLDEDV